MSWWHIQANRTRRCDVQARPVLANSCAWAATAAEASYRIDATVAAAPATRVVALDGGAEAALRRVAQREWAHARFYTCGYGPQYVRSNGHAAGLRLRTFDGGENSLEDELDEASATVMIATADEAAYAAAAIGAACAVRGVMTAGLVLGRRAHAGAAVCALRPYAQVLMLASDEHDVTEVLQALRA